MLAPLWGQACLRASPHDPSSLRASVSAALSLALFRSTTNNRPSRFRRAPLENPIPTPARIFRARVSHISIFQNVGSALDVRAKTPRNHTSDSASEARAIPTFSHIHTLLFLSPFSIFLPPKRGENQNPPFPQLDCDNRATNSGLSKGACWHCAHPSHVPLPDRKRRCTPVTRVGFPGALTEKDWHIPFGCRTIVPFRDEDSLIRFALPSLREYR
jgi:hypothetical protein